MPILRNTMFNILKEVKYNKDISKNIISNYVSFNVDFYYYRN